MSRRLVNITLDNLGDLPLSCRSCVFWELDPVSKSRAEANDPALEKESWISSVLLEWGSCGKILYVDGVPAAYVLFAPPQYVPRSVAFPTSPVSADAVLLMTARVMSEFSGGGLGRMLIQGMAKDLTRRGVRAIEAFGDKQWTAPGAFCRSTTCSRSASRPSARTTEPAAADGAADRADMARGRRGGPGAAARLDDPRPGSAAAQPGRGQQLGLTGPLRSLRSGDNATPELGDRVRVARDNDRGSLVTGRPVPPPAEQGASRTADRDVDLAATAAITPGPPRTLIPPGEVSILHPAPGALIA